MSATMAATLALLGLVVVLAIAILGVVGQIAAHVDAAFGALL